MEYQPERSTSARKRFIAASIGTALFLGGCGSKETDYSAESKPVTLSDGSTIVPGATIRIQPRVGYVENGTACAETADPIVLPKTGIIVYDSGNPANGPFYGIDLANPNIPDYIRDDCDNPSGVVWTEGYNISPDPTLQK